MTIADLAHVLLRRWAALALLLVLSAVVCARLSSPHVVYWSQTDVRFTYPGPDSSNSLITTTDSVIATAGLIAIEFNDSNPGPRLSSDDVSIVDAGILDGVLVRLPNAGGQWATNFNEPRLDVQASGSDPEEVRARTAAAVASIEALLREHQRSAGVAQAALITPRASPATPIIAEARGSRVRAVVVSGSLGVGLSLSLVLYLDQVLLRRRIAHSRATTNTGAKPVNPSFRALARR